MPSYFAAPSSPFSDDDAKVIGPELANLAEIGASSPDEIVRYAEGGDSALRTYLHMDRPLEEVARSHYRYRARQMANSIMCRVRVADGYREVRAFHSIHVSVESDDKDAPVKRRYVTIQQVRESPAMAGQVVEQAKRELLAWERRYATYSDVFGPVLDAIASVTEKKAAP